MNKHFIYLLAACMLVASAFTTKQPEVESPDQVARAVFKALLENDSVTFAQAYDIDVPDLEWYKKKIKADSLLSEDTKEDYIEEFTAYMHKANKALSHAYNTKWHSILPKNDFKKEDIRYIESYYTQTNKKLGLHAMGIEIKFMYKGSYFFVDLSVFNINGQWKGVYINNVDSCDKYFDGY